MSTVTVPDEHSADAPGVDTVVVPAQLRPARAFDTASALVISYLTRLEPLGMWAVTRVVDGRQIMLTVEAPAYGITAGVEFPFAHSMCRSMVASTAPQIAPDVALVPDYATAAAIAPITVSAYLGTPIVRGDGSLFGTLCGYDPVPQPRSLMAHQPLLDVFSSMLSAVLDADTAATTAARELETARRQADTDVMTGLLNRRGWDRYLAQEEQRFQRFGDAACVIVLDLDHLKVVNDTHGHDTGDRYIRQAGQVLAATARSGDILSRLGGDEFGIVAVGATESQAEHLVRRMEHALHDAGVSGSFGHAPYSVVSGFPGAWRAADQAMYVQKKQRRAPHPDRRDRRSDR